MKSYDRDGDETDIFKLYRSGKMSKEDADLVDMLSRKGRLSFSEELVIEQILKKYRNL